MDAEKIENSNEHWHAIYTAMMEKRPFSITPEKHNWDKLPAKRAEAIFEEFSTLPAALPAWAGVQWLEVEKAQETVKILREQGQAGMLQAEAFREAVNLLHLYVSGFLPDTVAGVFLEKINTNWPGMIDPLNPNAVPPRFAEGQTQARVNLCLQTSAKRSF